MQAAKDEDGIDCTVILHLDKSVWSKLGSGMALDGDLVARAVAEHSANEQKAAIKEMKQQLASESQSRRRTLVSQRGQTLQTVRKRKRRSLAASAVAASGISSGARGSPYFLDFKLGNTRPEASLQATSRRSLPRNQQKLARPFNLNGREGKNAATSLKIFQSASDCVAPEGSAKDMGQNLAHTEMEATEEQSARQAPTHRLNDGQQSSSRQPLQHHRYKEET